MVLSTLNETKLKEHKGKNILCLDYGSKVIGMAFFRPILEPIPYPLGRIINKSLPQTMKEIQQVIQNEMIDFIIVGVPHLLDGKETSSTARVHSFISELKNHFPHLPLYEQDETLSTQAAKERMQNSPLYNFRVNMEKIDEVSAVIILEDFFGH